MKRLVVIISAVLQLMGCTKGNPLVGTEWVAVETNLSAFDVYSYILSFHSEDQGTMTSNDFVHEEESVEFSYSYIEPNVVLTVRDRSISGVLNKDQITFKGMGFNRQTLTFNKVKK
jgi:hypothetical protein